MGLAVAALGAAVAFGTGTTVAGATTSTTPVTTVTLTSTSIKGLPASLAPGYHTFVVLGRGRQFGVGQPVSTSYTLADFKKDFAKVSPLFNGPNAKALKAYDSLIKKFTFRGGVGPTDRYLSATFTTYLSPGAVFFDNSPAEDGKDNFASVPVTGTPVGTAPTAVGSIDTHEFGFLTHGLTPGRHTYSVKNVGSQPHFVDIAAIDPGHTDADVLAALQSDGPPPAFIHDAGYIDVLSAGQSQYVSLDLRKGGEYLLVCFMPDVHDGMPHEAHGMYKIVHLPS